MTQAELIKKFAHSFAQQGKVYRKKKHILATQAKGGEHIETITSDGLETFNVASAGDYIVTNLTAAGESYIVPKAKFEKRYALVEKQNSNQHIYQATSQITALELTAELLKALDLPSEFHFTAGWGEQMVAKKGDYLAMPKDAKPEIYRIAAVEFGETYGEDEV